MRDFDGALLDYGRAIALEPGIRWLIRHGRSRGAATAIMGGGALLVALILAAVFLIVGFQIVLIGLLADVMSGNRKLLEDMLYRVRLMELGAQPESTTPDSKNGTPSSSR